MLHRMAQGSFEANCYILQDDATGDALIVDCAAYTEAFGEALRGLGITTLSYILLTHGHFDHICGAKPLQDAFGGRICIHPADAAALSDPQKSLSAQMAGYTQVPCKADILVEEGSRLPFGGGEITVMHTPGHSPGSVCYLYNDLMFSGDTLFYLSMGRTDLPGGSTKQLFASLRRIGQMPGEYVILPGHGEQTALSFEKRCNRYLRAQ